MMNLDLLFNKAKAQGIQDVQVFLTQKNELSIEVYNGDLEKYEISDSSSLTIRGIFNHRFGSFITEVMDDSVIELAIDQIIANAKIIDSPDEAIIYEGDPEYRKLDGSFQEALAQKDAGEKIAATKSLDSAVHQKDSRVAMGQTFYGETTKSVLLQNTKGLKLFNKANSALIGGEVLIKDENDQRTGFDLEISNNFADFDLPKLAATIVEEGTNSLGSKPVPSGNYEIILRRDALAVLLLTFQNVFSADAVHKNISLLKGKLHEKIGSPLVTIIDDPFLNNSSSSRSFDDEGCATQYKELVRKGVLTTYLHNLTTAKKDGLKTTGNGFGGGVSFVNMKLLSGDLTYDQLISSVENGLLITGLEGAHAGANPVSGDFSLQAKGFVIQNGQLGAPVALITVSGNFITLLQDVVAIGNDAKLGYYGVSCPSVKIKSLPVSGS